MKDDLNKPEDKKQKQPKFEKKSTDQRMQATPPVDNSGEEEIPEWKSSIRREPVQEEQPERKMPVINKKYMIAAALRSPEISLTSFMETASTIRISPLLFIA
jgi:inhibitor of cysteine peptidase